MKYQRNIQSFLGSPLRVLCQKVSALLVLFTLIIIPTTQINAMDLARAETRTDLAVATFGTTGQGVIVALLDRGIDWKNNDFRNTDGTTRIKYIFDLSDNTGAGAPGNTYGRGTIYRRHGVSFSLRPAQGATPLA